MKSSSKTRTKSGSEPKHPRPNAALQRRIIKNAEGHMQMFKAFKNVFARSLDDFWIDSNAGFDVVRFSKELVRPGKRSLIAAVRLKWGAEGAVVIKRLTSK